ncbi:MAG: glycosyltransferase family 4 protein [Nitrospinae bacterium]|nr:glycosyltransferase family 4 protein [Nitrospinota bacterium]
MKKNIRFILNSPDVRGGGELSILSLLKRIDRDHYNIIAVSPGEGMMSLKIREMGISVEIIPMKRLRYLNIISLLYGISRLLRVIHIHRIDLIHANGSRCMIYGGLTGMIKRIPVIWHVRIAEMDRVLDRFLSLLATKIIVISNSVKDRFKCLRNKDKIEIIYNGIDIDDFNSDINYKDFKKEFSIPINDTVVGTVSQFIPMKGIEFFIEAAKFILERVGNVKFMIAGKGVGNNGYEKWLKKMARDFSIEHEVIFTGYRDDIKSMIASFDIFVLASIGEAFGRVLIEAMALKKPVVATKSGGIPEIVVDGETGILVPVKDSKAIATAVMRLITEKETRDKMGKAGRKRVEEMFNIERHVKEIEAQYLRIMG